MDCTDFFNTQHDNTDSIGSNFNFLFLDIKRRFRLPSHLPTLKNLFNEKSGKRGEKSGKYLIKSGNREILRRLIFFLYPRLENLIRIF